VFTRLATAYVLGEELMDIKFKNEVLGRMLEATKQKMSFEVTGANIIYASTNPGSAARRLVSDLCAEVAAKTGFKAEAGRSMEGLNHQMLVDSLMAMKPRLDKKRKWSEIDIEEYCEVEKD
jgi:hypothetical protein